MITEGLVQRGLDVTLFATADSVTTARLHAVCPTGTEENPDLDDRVWESLHIAEVFERAHEFDLIHNHLDFAPLTYSRFTSTPVVTTIHGFSSPRILPAYRKYDGTVSYVSISNADRVPDLHYCATVYHGIQLSQFLFQSTPDDYLLFFGRIHSDKGTAEAIEIARRANRRLLIAGIIQDQEYYRREVEPHLDGTRVVYVGNVGPEKRSALLGGAIALLHPINFSEPFGLSVVEALACGTPVIAMNRGSMPELLTHGQTGFLVRDVDEAVAAVGQLSAIDRGACRRHAEERFSADRMVDDYLAVYQKILAGTRLPGPVAGSHNGHAD